MTPSVSQSSGCCLRRTLRSARPIPSFPCSSSISRSCELLFFTMTGPILRRNIPSLYIGCTLVDSLVRRITDLSWRVDGYKDVWEAWVVPFTRRSMLGYKHKQDRPSTGCLKIMWQKCSSTDSRLELFQNVLEVLSGTPIKRT